MSNRDVRKTGIPWRVVLFLAVLLVVVLALQYLFCVRDYSIYSMERGFLQEAEDSLDAVYIGASHVLCYYEPPLAWKDYGVSIYNYAIPSLRAPAVKYRLIEARKTQPDALYLINLNSFKTADPGEVQSLHHNLDHMPWSLNKLRLLQDLTRRAGITGADKLEFFLPVIRFHSDWSEMTHSDFVHPKNGLKGARIFEPFLKNSADMTGQFGATDERTGMDEELEGMFTELLDYCQAEQVRVLFVVVPQVFDAEALARMYQAADMARSRGFPVLDLTEHMDEMGLRVDQDYRDKKHLNIHGAIKLTDYLARCLAEDYGFADKRGEPGWESWDAAAEKYDGIIGPYTLPLERDHAPRDYDLAVPALDTPRVEGQTVTLSWSETEGAEGYEIYCKSKIEADGYWYYLAAVEDSLSYVDGEGLAAGTAYTYTVVPYDTAPDGTVRYGNFDYAGVRAVTEGE